MTTPLSYFLDDDDKRRHDFVNVVMHEMIVPIDSELNNGAFWSSKMCMAMWLSYKAGRDFEASKNAPRITLPVVSDTNWYEVNVIAKDGV